MKVLDEFNSFIKPVLDKEKAIELNLDPIEDEALKITNIKVEELESAPELNIVWSNFVEFVNRYNPKKSQWNAPVRAGFNIKNFDDEIIRRCCEQFGPFDKNYSSQALFHPFNTFDVIDDIYKWTENNIDIKSISMDSVRLWMGLPKDGAHNSLVDVRQGVEIMIKFLKLYRHFAPKIKFENCFGGKTDV